MKKIIIITILIITSGCGRMSESALKEVLEKDPSFEKILSEKKRIHAKISLLKDSYDKEKDIAIQKIRSLKKESQNKKYNLNEQVYLLKQEIEPKIQALAVVLKETKSNYKLTKKGLDNSISKLKNIRKLLEKKGELSLSGDEISVWSKRVNDLEKEIASFRHDLDKLRSKIHLLKTEVEILKE